MDSPGKSLLLTGFGIELLTHIQLFLDPVDILALRFTCKHLSGATRSRVVWMNAVRNVSIAQGVFLPSFPVEQMSLDDLEHAALSPRRLRARLQKTDRTTPFLTRLFTRHFQRGALGSNWMLSVKLVPGGRFLLTLSFEFEYHLWDIGYNAGGHMKTFPVATLASSGGSRRLDLIGPASNSDSLYLFSNEDGERQAVASVCIIETDFFESVSCYEIYPTSEDPHFSQLSTLGYDGQAYLSTISEDYWACYNREISYITVWKYTAQGLGVSWIVPYPDDVHEMFISDNNLITFHTTDFCLWTIPDLTPLIDGHATVIDLEPKLRLAYLSVNQGGPKVALPSRWLPEFAQTQFGVYYDEISTIALYEIKSIDTSQEPDLPNILPIHSGSVQYSQSPLDIDTDDRQPLHITEDGFLHTWLTRKKQIAIGIISKPSPNNPTYSFVRSSIWNGSRRKVDYDFCPMTGRLIISFNLYQVASPEIQIVDFVLPRSFL